MRDAPAVVALFATLISAEEPYALEPRWDGAPVTSSLRAIGLADGDRRCRTSTPTCCATRRVRDAARRAGVDRWSAAGRPPGEGVDARPRCRRTRIAARHRGDGVPPRSRARGSTSSKISRFATCRSKCARPEPGRGHARSRRRRGDGADRSAGRGGAAARRRAASKRSRRGSSPTSTSASSCRSCGCSGRWNRPASASTASSSTPCAPISRSSADVLVQRIYAHAGEEFNVNSTPQLRTILFEKLGLVPVKKTKTGRVDRRRLAPEDGRRASDRRRRSSATARSRSCAAPTPTRCRR